MGISKTTLVTGACGLLENGPKELAPCVLYVDVAELDITSVDAVQAMFEEVKH